jgi:hypothetical protein
LDRWTLTDIGGLYPKIINNKAPALLVLIYKIF